MKRFIHELEAGLLIISVMAASISCDSNNEIANPANTQTANTTVTDAPPSQQETVQTIKFTEQELDQLLAPVALYPDPIIAQMLPAATFVDQIKEAQRTLNGESDDSLIANRDWDVSVKSIAHYPPVLKMMAEDEDWTTTLGQAYLNQPDDISRSIQRLRGEAADAGNLFSTPQQEVVEKDDIITIEPAEPQRIYSPQYNSETVYVEEAPDEYYEDDDDGISTGTAIAIGALAFGAGLLIGSWLNRDYDYYGYYGPPGVYYHGWNGGGWIGVNRGYADIDINRNIYINDNYRNVNVNRGVYNRNVTNYRSNLTRNATLREQRVTNARVDRQLKRQQGVKVGRDKFASTGDRDVGGRKLERGGPDRNRDGATLDRDRDARGGASRDRDVGGASRQRDMDRNRRDSSAGRASSAGRGSTRSSGGSSGWAGRHGAERGGNTERRSAPQQRSAQQQRSAPQRSAPQRSAPQRSAPQRSGGGGRRRG